MSNITNIASSGTLVTCPNCGNRFSAQLEQIIDVTDNDRAKSIFLSGQHNAPTCPNCQMRFNVSVPIAYHDANKDLLMVYVPMELNLNNDEQERIVGQLTRTVTEALPMEQRKGYLFNPRRAFTLQGMMESILEEDGITKEMLQARQGKLELVQRVLTTPPDQYETFAQENDEVLDEDFFNMMSSMVETALATGNQSDAYQIAQIRDHFLQFTSYGQEVIATMQAQEAAMEAVATDLQAMGDDVSYEGLLDLAITYAEDDQKLQFLVGFVRQAMDYQFLEMLSERISNAESDEEAEMLEYVRDRIIEWSEQVDRQRQAQVQQATALIQELVNQPNMEEAVAQYLPAINDLVLAVIDANIQASEEHGDTQLAQRLMQLKQIIHNMISQSSPPEVQFISELLQAPSEMDARLMLLDHAHEYGDGLLETIDALIDDLTQRGADGIVEQLIALREEAENVLNS